MTIDEPFRLDGRVAFVSGAAGHLGRAMTAALLDAGANVIVNGRNPARLAQLSEALGASGYAVRPAVFDMADIAAVRAYFGALPRLDVLVNNAISMTVKPMHALDAGDFEITYRSSVTAAFEAVRASLPALRRGAQGSGEASVVMVASMYGIVSPDQRLYSNPDDASPFHYGPAKAALLQLTRHLAAALGSEHIRVNALVPGPFPRPEAQASDPAFAARLAERTMLRRLGNAQEIAGPLLFLASPASAYMTGASLVIDGGWTAW